MTNSDDPERSEGPELSTAPSPTEPDTDDDEVGPEDEDDADAPVDEPGVADDSEEPPRSRYESSGRPREERGSHGSRRSGFEGLFRDSFKKAVERGLEVGLGTLKSADHVVRNVADEVKLPKEISNYLFSQIDETKNVLIKAVAGEVRSFLDSTDLATELQRALTALAFEVRMEIRFIPNESGELKPSVKAKAVPRARRPERKASARREDDDDRG